MADEGITLRAARFTVEDALQLWTWQRDAAVRAASLSPGPATWADHLTWFGRVLKDPSRRLFIVERADQAVGMARLDGRTEEAEVSLLVDADHRGRGIGRLILGALAAVAVAAGHCRLVAHVKDDNPVSRRLFESCGYETRCLLASGDQMVWTFVREGAP